MRNKNDADYLNFNDLNEIEKDIKLKTDEVKKTTTIPDFKEKKWVKNELPFIQEIQRIETGVENLGEYTEKPLDWQNSRLWVDDIFPYSLETFDYNDYNRWINNLSLIDTTGLDKDTYWNGFSLINWDETSKYDWSEKKQDKTLKGIIIKLFSKIKNMIKFIRFKGFTKQETTEGYNLFKPIPSATKSGVTCTYNSNGSYTFTGDAIANTSFYIAVNYDVGEYTIFMNNNEITTDGFYCQAEKNGLIQGSVVFATSKNYKKTFNAPNGISVLVFVVNQGMKLTNFIVKPMLIKGKENKPFEPYTGGQQSPSPDYPQEIEVGRGKRNLWNNAVVKTEKIIEKLPTGFKITKSDITRFGPRYEMKIPAGTYKGIAKLKTNSKTTNSGFQFFFADGSTETRSFEVMSTLQPTTFKKDIIVIQPYIDFSEAVGTYYELSDFMILKANEQDTSYISYNTLEVVNKGINKFNINNDYKIGQMVNLGGVSVTYNDDYSITLNGTVSAPDIKIVNQNYNIKLNQNKYWYSNVISGSYTGPTIWFTNRDILQDGSSDFDQLMYIDNEIKKTSKLIKSKSNSTGISNYYRIFAKKGVVFNNFKLQLMITDNKADKFEPYREQKVQYKLGDNFLADKDYIINGKLFKNTAEYVFTGDENIQLFNVGVGTLFRINLGINNIKPSIGIKTIKSNYFLGTIEGVRPNNSITINNAKSVDIIANQFKTLEEFKQWLKDQYNAGNPVKVLYETEETNTQQLETVGELTITEGNNIISNSIDTENTIGYEEE